MKKIISLVFLMLSAIMLFGCNEVEKISIINVGDYINDQILYDFMEYYKEETGKSIRVVYTELSSNEDIYNKLKNERYDICVVSDYMIERMRNENMLRKVDYSRFIEMGSLFSDAEYLINLNCSNYKDYFIPYFWGTLGILYRTDVPGLEDYVLSFDDLTPIYENNEYNKGMYLASRDSISMAISISSNYDINTTDENIIREYGLNTLINVEYRALGDDCLKAFISPNNHMLDLALVYSGDYLDEYYQCYMDNNEDDSNINFNYYAPDKTNIWVDGVCMLENSDDENLDNVYMFLNYLYSTDVFSENADYIGYCPLIEDVYNLLYLPLDEGGYGYDYDNDIFYPYKESRIPYMFKYMGKEHYDLLKDMFDEVRSKFSDKIFE